MLKKLIITSLIVFNFSHLSLAFNQAGYNGLNNNLLEMGFSSASLALAEANLAQSNNALGALNNPASLRNTCKQSLHFLQSSLGQGIDIFSVNYTVPFYEKWTFALNWAQVQVTEIPIVTQDFFDLNTDIEATQITTARENALTSALAYNFSPQLTAGLSLNLFQQQFSNLNESGFGLSLRPGLVYQFSDNFSVGAYVDNALAYQNWSTNYQERPEAKAHLGLGYTIGNLQLFSAIEKSATSPFIFKYACEYTLCKILKLRLGLYPEQFIYPIQQINCGIGLKIDRFSLDYSYIGDSKNNYGSSSRINFGVFF